MAKRIPWTQDELHILRTYFPVEGSAILRRLPGRTYQSIQMMARRAGIPFPRDIAGVQNRGDGWTKAEDAVVRKYYSAGILAVRERLPHRSDSAIQTRAGILGLRPSRQVGWSAEEDALLCRYYPVEGAKVVARLQGRSREAVYNRVQVLGLGGNRVRWSAEEDDLLRRYWTSSTDVGMLRSRLPDRTDSAIIQRAHFLGLGTRGPAGRYAWTAEEDAILRKYYPKEGRRVASRLPGHSAASCAIRVQQLGVHYTGR